jgi:hypothetical protein
MKLSERIDRIRTRQIQAGGWTPESRAENELFDACCEVLEAARRLERATADPAAGRAALASTGCLGAAFESLAHATLVMHGSAAPATSEPVEIRERLLGASANLRLASRACEIR